MAAGSQTDGLTRWGDYSAMSVDPIDDCTMYYTNEYLKTTGSFNWSTKVEFLQVQRTPAQSGFGRY